ncbi:MAG: hypothetical protein JW971_08680 [Synergistales bacterium]|nr:hypothetical protein [Synergistales bacterium]
MGTGKARSGSIGPGKEIQIMDSIPFIGGYYKALDKDEIINSMGKLNRERIIVKTGFVKKRCPQ